MEDYEISKLAQKEDVAKIDEKLDQAISLLNNMANSNRFRQDEYPTKPTGQMFAPQDPNIYNTNNQNYYTEKAGDVNLNLYHLGGAGGGYGPEPVVTPHQSEPKHLTEEPFPNVTVAEILGERKPGEQKLLERSFGKYVPADWGEEPEIKRPKFVPAEWTNPPAKQSFSELNPYSAWELEKQFSGTVTIPKSDEEKKETKFFRGDKTIQNPEPRIDYPAYPMDVRQKDFEPSGNGAGMREVVEILKEISSKLEASMKNQGQQQKSPGQQFGGGFIPGGPQPISGRTQLPSQNLSPHTVQPANSQQWVPSTRIRG